jgi:hypothetical protein
LGPGSGAFLTPESGSGIRAGKKSRHDLEFGMNIQDLIFENLLSVFRVKNTYIFKCKFGSGIQDLVNPGSGMEKVGSGIFGSGINIPDPQQWC